MLVKTCDSGADAVNDCKGRARWVAAANSTCCRCCGAYLFFIPCYAQVVEFFYFYQDCKLVLWSNSCLVSHAALARASATTVLLLSAVAATCEYHYTAVCYYILETLFIATSDNLQVTQRKPLFVSALQLLTRLPFSPRMRQRFARFRFMFKELHKFIHFKYVMSRTHRLLQVVRTQGGCISELAVTSPAAAKLRAHAQG